jgi:tRNA A-37 threonylcarbamoyl transferase component Bud32
MLERIVDLVHQKWDECFPEIKRPRSSTVSFLEITGSVIGGTSTFLAFYPGYPKPLFVVKLFRDKTETAKIRRSREARVLALLNTERQIFGDAIPRVALHGEIDSTQFLVQTFINGRPLQASLDAKGFPHIRQFQRQLEDATTWLSNLYTSTQCTDSSQAAIFIDSRNKIIDEFAGSFMLSKHEHEWIENVKSWLETIQKDQLCVVHNDFCRQNILENKKVIRIIDWSDSELIGYAGHDLLFYCTTYFLQLRAKHGIQGFEEAFTQTFITDNRYSRIVLDAVMRYARLTRNNSETLHYAMTLFLIERALFDYKQLSDNARLGRVPSFNLILANELKLPFEHIGRGQFWFYLFRLFVPRAHEFSQRAIGHAGH